MSPVQKASTANRSRATAPKRFGVGVALLIVAGLPAPLSSDEKKPPLKTVIVSVTGDWTHDGGNRPVSFGESFGGLPQGSDENFCFFGTEGSIIFKKVKIEPEVQAGRDADAGSLFVFSCDTGSRDPQCGQGHSGSQCSVNANPYREWKRSAGGESASGSIWSALRRVTQNPQKYMVAVSRGVEEELDDAVVPLQNGQLDLSAAFRDMGAGKYRISIWPIQEKNAAATATGELGVKPGTPALIEAGATNPGIYRLSLVDQETNQQTGSDAWILVDGPNNYSADAAAFQGASDQASKLPQEMDASAARGLLRAYLESLNKNRKEQE